jgi:hypothetical protein
MLLSLYPHSGYASDLKWETKAIIKTVSSDDHEVFADFRFKNDTSHEVTLTSPRCSCSCGQATTDRTTYKSGETGVVHVRMGLLGIGTGQRVSIFVVTGSTPNQTDTLDFRVKIPSDCSFEPRFLEWKLNAPVIPKTVHFTTGVSRVLDSLEIESGVSSQIDLSQQTIIAGKKIDLIVRPHSTASPVTVQINGWLHFHDGKRRPFLFFLFVR